MDRKAWQKKNTGWILGGSTGGAIVGMSAGKQVDQGRIAGALVAIIVATLIPYLAWFFASDGRKAYR